MGLLLILPRRPTPAAYTASIASSDLHVSLCMDGGTRLSRMYTDKEKTRYAEKKRERERLEEDEGRALAEKAMGLLFLMRDSSFSCGGLFFFSFSLYCQLSNRAIPWNNRGGWIPLIKLCCMGQIRVRSCRERGGLKSGRSDCGRQEGHVSIHIHSDVCSFLVQIFLPFFVIWREESKRSTCIPIYPAGIFRLRKKGRKEGRKEGKKERREIAT